MIKCGLFSGTTLLNLVLCLFGGIPAVLHAWYIILKNPGDGIPFFNTTYRLEISGYQVVDDNDHDGANNSGSVSGGANTTRSNSSNSRTTTGHYRPDDPEAQTGSGSGAGASSAPSGSNASPAPPPPPGQPPSYSAAVSNGGSPPPTATMDNKVQYHDYDV